MAKRGNGQGAVYLRGDGRWEAQIRLAGGRRKSLYGPIRREVVRRLRETRWLLAQGLPVSARKMTVGLLLASWLELTRERIRPSTYESYELNVRRIGETLGDLPLLQLTAPDIQSAYRRMRERGLTEHSLNQVHGVLDRALRHALQWGLIARNPAVIVFAPRPRRREMTALSAEELMRLLDHARGHRLWPLLVVLGTAGLRIGEALGLRWRDVDLVAGRLVVRQALQRRRGVGLVFVEPKTPRSRRTVHLIPLAVDALAEQRRWEEERRQAASSLAESGLVFTNLSGGPIESGNVSANLTRMLADAGLPRIRVHDLRHTTATALLEAGVHPKLVQDLLGHSTIAVTLDTYSHVAPALHQRAALQLQELLVKAGSARVSRGLADGPGIYRRS
jgi:integrase